MARNLLETLLGAVVLIVAIVFLIFAYESSQIRESGGYELVAQFSQVDGLDSGADVRISGIKVGSVIQQTLDPKTYQAEVRFTVREGIELPSDSSAAIVTSGLLGGKYLQLVPGGDTVMLKPGDEITLTQSALNLEDLIGQAIFGRGGGGAQGGGEAASGGAAAPGGAGASDGGGGTGSR
jgi:phospholipid/cholesterol/gamma-HCH transport system substrate-binding protein